MQEYQDFLYKLSQKGKIFRKIMPMVTLRGNILLAYRNIKKNAGSKTKGMDGKDISYFANIDTDTIVDIVQDKLNNFHPNKVRRVLIPKANGKMRPLGIPSILDRLIQQCILQVLEPICEAKFYKHSYGFRPLRNTKQAISRAYHLAQKNKLHYVVDVDIKGFFDNINHGKLLKQLWTLGIRDKALLKIISKMLKAEIENEGIPSKGTPQGGILSPLLANIVLNELDWWIASQWEEIPTRYEYSQKNKKYRALKKTKLKEVFIVRYADDFKLFCRTHQEAVKIFEATKQWLKNRLQLQVSKEKSKIVCLRKNYSDFLGIKFKLHKKGKNGKDNKWVIKSHISNKAFKTIKENARKHIDNIQKPKETLNKSIDLYNSFVMGVHNYYNCATHCNIDMSKLVNRIRAKIYNGLKCRKVNQTDKLSKYIINTYGRSKMLRMMGEKVILPLSYIQHKKLMNCKQQSIYNPIDRVEIHCNQKVTNPHIIKYLLANPIRGQSVEYNDNRISLYVGQLGRCAITKDPLDVGNMECHHKLPKKLGGTDEYENLVLINSDIHKLIHSKKIETITKYLNFLDIEETALKKLNKLRVKAGNFKISL